MTRRYELLFHRIDNLDTIIKTIKRKRIKMKDVYIMYSLNPEYKINGGKIIVTLELAEIPKFDKIANGLLKKGIAYTYFEV